jgi:high-affinity iron transporter
MFQVSIVIFRESLEILFLLVIIYTASINKVKNIKFDIAVGTALGILGAIILAVVTEKLEQILGSSGQEIFNSALIFFTATLLGFNTIRMQNYSKKIRAEINTIHGQEAYSLKQKMLFIALVAFSIFREGAEIVLFIQGIMAASKISLLNCMLGISAGCIAAMLAGALFYQGLLKTSKVFQTTSILLMLITAGLISEGFGILGRAGMIDILSERAWDMSWLVSDGSLLGQFLKILINYNSRPSVLEVASFMLSFVAIFSCNYIIKRAKTA